jgi:hypothetical protein
MQILGNVGTIISFRLGLSDAEILENEFRPEICAMDQPAELPHLSETDD